MNTFMFRATLHHLLALYETTIKKNIVEWDIQIPDYAFNTPIYYVRKQPFAKCTSAQSLFILLKPVFHIFRFYE